MTYFPTRAMANHFSFDLDDSAEWDSSDLSPSTRDNFEAMDRWLDRVVAREKNVRKRDGPSSSLPTVVDLFAELPAPRPKFMTELWIGWRPRYRSRCRQMSHGWKWRLRLRDQS